MLNEKCNQESHSATSPHLSEVELTPPPAVFALEPIVEWRSARAHYHQANACKVPLEQSTSFFIDTVEVMEESRRKHLESRACHMEEEGPSWDVRYELVDLTFLEYL